MREKMLETEKKRIGNQTGVKNRLKKGKGGAMVGRSRREAERKREKRRTTTKALYALQSFLFVLSTIPSQNFGHQIFISSRVFPSPFFKPFLYFIAKRLKKQIFLSLKKERIFFYSRDLCL